MHTPRTSSRSGFTLIEIAIVAIILSVVMGTVGVFELSNRRTLQQFSAVGSAQERAHQALERC